MTLPESVFHPPLLMRNAHVQSIISSAGPREFIVRRRARQLLAESNTHTLDCGNGIRLQGEYACRTENQNGLVIMIHGWLGCNDSLYLLSAGSHLYAAGYNIFRLNLRDHGHSHHLNKGIFNSTRIDEVVNAVKAIQTLAPHQHNFLTGFSLGGNFSLRVAVRAPQNDIALDKVVAVCPVINPLKTNRNLHEGWFVYHNHFLNKWKRALRNKLEAFPDYDYAERLKPLKTLDEMNDFFVPNYTAYDDVKEYLLGYSIGRDKLAKLQVPCRIISSKDDPIIRADDLQELDENPQLSIELTEHGGHCGYIDGFSLNSWIDERLLQLFAGVQQP